MNIDNIRRTLQSRLNKNRFAHSVGVADTAVKLAAKFGVDTDKAYIAGLLHDCARQFDDSDLITQAELRNIPIDNIMRAVPLLLHSYIGAQMISEVYGVEDIEIAQAVANHTLGAEDMNSLDKIIYIADMIEPGRNFPAADELRALAFNTLPSQLSPNPSSLNSLTLSAVDSSVLFVIRKHSFLHPRTVSCRNSLIYNLQLKINNS